MGTRGPDYTDEGRLEIRSQGTIQVPLLRKSGTRNVVVIGFTLPP